MAWTDPSGGSAVTAGTATAAEWNSYVIDNQIAAFPDEVEAVEGTSQVGDDWVAVLSTASSTVDSGFWRVGAICVAWCQFILDGGGVGTGIFTVNLPFTASGLAVSTNAGQGQTIGHWQARDNDVPANNEGGAVQLRDADTIEFNRPTGGVVTDSLPFSWEGDDVLSFFVIYPTASG